jgi:hypothetical protein
MFLTLTKDYFGQKAGTTLDIDEPHWKSLLDKGVVEAVKGDPYGPLMTKAKPTCKPTSWRSPATTRSSPPSPSGLCRDAIEDNEDRFTLDVDVQTDLGKSLPFAVLEFKSNEFKPLPAALLAIGLKPVKISKFLWATER